MKIFGLLSKFKENIKQKCIFSLLFYVIFKIFLKLFEKNGVIHYTTQDDFFRELNSTIFHRFLAVCYDSVLSIFSAGQ
jgi:hypothetical protein